MHSNVDRKEAIRKFKERKPPAGAFALRCSATGQVWVGSALNLEAMRNRFWFCLRNGDHPDKAVQKEWNAHGEQTFQYEILETLEELPAFGVADALNEKKRHWVTKLGAIALIA